MIGTAKKIIDEMLNAMQADPKKVYEVKPYHEKRSRSQNAYFHTLIDQMAQAHTLTIAPISTNAMKNTMIARYGKKMRHPDGEPLAIKTNARPEEMQEMAFPHTAFAMDNGDGTFTYWWMQRTSDMDTKEMAALIRATVDEAKLLGVETMTPAELTRLYEQERRAKHEKYHHEP